MSSYIFPFIMPTERNIYFANDDAYNILETVDYMYTIRDRMALFEFDHIIAELSDMRWVSYCFHGDPMYDPFLGTLIRRDEWFRRYGIRDSTMAHFFGDFEEIDSFMVSEIEMEAWMHEERNAEEGDCPVLNVFTDEKDMDASFTGSELSQWSLFVPEEDVELVEFDLTGTDIDPLVIE